MPRNVTNAVFERYGGTNSALVISRGIFECEAGADEY